MVEPKQSTAPIPVAAESGPELVTRPTSLSRLTVSEWGKDWLDLREREGVRSVRTDRCRWRTHVDTAPWASRPLSEVTRAEAREWVAALAHKRRSIPGHKSRPFLAVQTMRNALHLVRVAFEDARAVGLCSDNPFVGLKVRKRSTKSAWTVLRPEEQKRLLGVLSDVDRCLVAFALGSCMRAGEQFALRLDDVHVDGDRPHAIVRFGAFPDLPTKSGRPRRVPLFGIALRAMREWLSRLASFAARNPHGLAFPRENGEPRKGAPTKLIQRMRKALGRHVRWHDLRHTGATSLVAGWWGAPWALHQTQRLCGHFSVSMTERYTHWLDEDEGLGNIAQATEAHMVDGFVEQRGIEPLTPGAEAQECSCNVRDPLDGRHEPECAKRAEIREGDRVVILAGTAWPEHEGKRATVVKVYKGPKRAAGREGPIVGIVVDGHGETMLSLASDTLRRTDECAAVFRYLGTTRTRTCLLEKGHSGGHRDDLASENDTRPTHASALTALVELTHATRGLESAHDPRSELGAARERALRLIAADPVAREYFKAAFRKEVDR